jgi:hypothetical protein
MAKPSPIPANRASTMLVTPYVPAMTGALKPCFLDPADASWIDFIDRNPDANVFHRPEWMNLLASCYGYQFRLLAMTDSAGTVRAALPMMEVATLMTGRHGVSLPYTDHC